MICDMKLKWQSIKCGSNAAQDFALVLMADDAAAAATVGVAAWRRGAAFT